MKLRLKYFFNPADNKLLHTKSIPVDLNDLPPYGVIDEMIAIMKQHNGIGLAAPQIGLLYRFVVVLINGEYITMMNPEFIHDAAGSVTMKEGCLSMPGVYIERCNRYKSGNVKYYDMNGIHQNIHVDNLESVCIQHEIDHLNGIGYHDMLSPFKKIAMQKQSKKARLG